MIKVTRFEFEIAQIIQNQSRTLKGIREELFKRKFQTSDFHNFIELIVNLEIYLRPSLFKVEEKFDSNDAHVTLLKNLSDLEVSFCMMYSSAIATNVCAKMPTFEVTQLEYLILHAVFENFLSTGIVF